MLRTFFDFRRISTLIALLLITALAAVMFASAPAETQTSPTDATATPTATGTAIATATPTATPTPDPDATATPTATATGTATATPTATLTATPTVPPLNADYDVDNDGLIEIRTLAQLNAVRYDLDGDGKRGSVSASDWATYTTAFLNAASDMGCQLTDHDSDAATPQQATCTGYELMMDLDFDTDRDGDVDSSDTYPNWTPIGTDVNPFNATFKGNIIDGVMPKISNLTVNSTSGRVGLFGETGANAHIESVGIANAKVSVTSSSQVDIGALAGSNGGKVIACYSTGAITATAGTGSYAGGLIGYQTTTASTAASFSRATVSMSIDPAVTDAARMYIYAGGLMGHNSGTITAAYAAGAVKGKGGSSSYVGGLVGDNNGTITASYSIAPVTAAAGSTITPGGLVGYNDRTNGAITASYWDYISSGIDDDSDTAMPEGKSTYDLLTPTSATGIYSDWDDLTIDADGANNDDPWGFSHTALHPQLTYGGHATTRDLSGNQRLASIEIASQHGGHAVRPREGMTFGASGAGGYPPLGLRDGVWIWESSPDGINWTILSPLPGKHGATLRGIGGNFGGTHFFIPMPEHVGKYIRTRILLTTGDYLTSRPIGKIKAADTATALSFTTVLFGPRVEWEITIASLPSGAVGLWYRCDANDASPPTTGCELVGSRASYTPETVDVDHYLYAYIYYKNAAGAWLRSDVGFTQNKVGGFRGSQWRNFSD